MLVDRMRVEVLNTTYELLSPVSLRRALNLVSKGKAVVLTEHDDLFIGSATCKMPVPRQIKLRTYVKVRPVSKRPAELNNHNLHLRDKYQCSYCRRHRTELGPNEFLTRDHIHPQDKGGEDNWLNVTTACSTCNNKKANLFLSQTKFTLAREPYVPTRYEMWAKSRLNLHKRKA